MESRKVTHKRKPARTRFMLIVVSLILLISGGIYWGKAEAIVTEPQLTKVGPISGDNGFPVWYKDINGTRMQLCLDKDDPNCGFLPGDIPDDTKPISFPDNFPEEAFYQLASAEMQTGTGERALGNFSLEAAFASDVPREGDQIVFGRVRFYIFGLKPNETYKITHPYGTDEIKATPEKNNPDVGEIKFTEDIGINGGFQSALKSRIGPFLQWDPTVEPKAPEGYLGDPNVEHPIVGSVLKNEQGEVQNFFRVEGPGIAQGANGTISPNVCLKPDPTKPGSTVQDVNCIEMKDFTLMGKKAVNAGVEIQQSTYNRTSLDGGTIDVFATSEEADQSLEVSGDRINPVRMTGKNGQYFARVAYTGEVPDKIVVTNVGDVPISKKEIKVVDQITGTATYDIDAKILTVNAQSTDAGLQPVPKLTLAGFGEIPEDGTFKDLMYIPPTITISSSQGGKVVIPVISTGKPFAPIPITAFAGVDFKAVGGDTVILDGSNSTGPIQSYAWEQVSGTPVELINANTVNPSFIAPKTTDTLVFQLTITGPGGPLTSTVKVETLESAPLPVANPGTSQTVAQGSVVTLDGSGSTDSTKYTWKQVGGTPVTLNAPTTAKPTFTFPKQPNPLVFELVTSGPGGTSEPKQVTISTEPDSLTVTPPEYRVKERSYRVEGTSTVKGPGVKIYIYKGDPANKQLIGTTDVDSLGDWRFRNTSTVVVTATDKLTIVSSSGGKLTDVTVRVR